LSAAQRSQQVEPRSAWQTYVEDHNIESLHLDRMLAAFGVRATLDSVACLTKSGLQQAANHGIIFDEKQFHCRALMWVIRGEAPTAPNGRGSPERRMPLMPPSGKIANPCAR
jgi:hypothetical protein